MSENSPAEQLSEPCYSPCLCDWVVEREKKKTKPHKEVKTPKEAKEWVGGAKEETKDEEWKKWGIDLLFN